MKYINIADLELYTTCSNLFKYHRDMQPLHLAPDKTLYQEMEEAILTAAFHKVLGRFKLSTIEKKLERSIKDFDKISPQVQSNIWMTLRVFLKELDDIDLKAVKIPILYPLRPLVITSEIDIITNDSVVFIDVGPKQLIRNNLRYKMALVYAFRNFAIEKATIYSSACEGKHLQKEVIEIDSFLLGGVDEILASLALATIHGPFYPLHKCRDLTCVHRKGCTL